jgi:hypothetical protein
MFAHCFQGSAGDVLKPTPVTLAPESNGVVAEVGGGGDISLTDSFFGRFIGRALSLRFPFSNGVVPAAAVGVEAATGVSMINNELLEAAEVAAAAAEGVVVSAFRLTPFFVFNE